MSQSGLFNSSEGSDFISAIGRCKDMDIDLEQIPTTYLGLITPRTAAARRIQKLSNKAKMTPLPTIKVEPNRRTALRPIASAKRVRKKLITTSPTRVKVIKRPIWASEIPNEDRYEAKISVEPP